MHKHSKKLLVLMLSVTALFAAGIWTLTHRPTYRAITGQSHAIALLPEPGKATRVVIDFADCSRGNGTVSFGLGSTRFAFSGMANDTCTFYMGTEIENPRWDGSLGTTCKVPASLGKRTYVVTNEGIRFEDLVSGYCS